MIVTNDNSGLRKIKYLTISSSFYNLFSLMKSTDEYYIQTFLSTIFVSMV